MVIPPNLADALRRRHHAKNAARVQETPRGMIRPKALACPDGDGFFGALSGESVSIRLWGLDAPEWGQHFARDAHLALSGMIIGEWVYAHVYRRDKYGRYVCHCFLEGGTDPGIELILRGLAWYSPLYAPQQNEYAKAQQLAQHYKRGIWSQADPLPPWRYRYLARKSKQKNVT